ncbi:hypothetical protein CsSME_00018950 [Camellia sinensis var. sinensis]
MLLVICPLEQQILSLRIIIQGLTNDENVKLHFVELEALDRKDLKLNKELSVMKLDSQQLLIKRVDLYLLRLGNWCLLFKDPSSLPTELATSSSQNGMTHMW